MPKIGNTTLMLNRLFLEALRIQNVTKDGREGAQRKQIAEKLVQTVQHVLAVWERNKGPASLTPEQEVAMLVLEQKQLEATYEERHEQQLRDANPLYDPTKPNPADLDLRTPEEIEADNADQLKHMLGE